MKLTPKLALALVLALAGSALVFTGALRHQPLVAIAGWLALACCGFLIAVIVYRHVVTLLTRIEMLSAVVRQLNGQVQASAKTSTKRFQRIDAAQQGHLQALTGLKTMQASALQLQADLRKQVQHLEETGRATSRQSADGQHFVLGAFRELSARHQQQDQALERLAERLDAASQAAAHAQEDLRKESAALIEHVDERVAAALAQLEKRSADIVKEIGRSRAAALDETSTALQLLRDSISGEISRSSAEARDETAAKLDLVQKKLLGELKRAGTETLHDTKAEIESVQGKVLSEIGRSRTDTLHETESMLQLMRLFELRAPVPLLGGWAMEPSSMLALISTILERKPALVVECGSGTSTVWLAYALAANGKGRLVSLDHEPDYAAATARALATHRMENIVDLRLAPLVVQSIEGEEFTWYDPAQLDDLEGTDVLIVDGPPSSTGPLARYPAIPLLGKYLSDQALVVVDDANRKDEKAIMRRWKDELPGLGEPMNLASRTALMGFQRVAG